MTVNFGNWGRVPKSVPFVTPNRTGLLTLRGLLTRDKETFWGEIAQSPPDPVSWGPKSILFVTLGRARELPQVLADKGKETKNAGRTTSRRFR